MADYVSAEGKCGVVRIVEKLNGRSVAYTCARAVRHDGEHKDRDGAHWLGKGPILWPSEKLCGASTSNEVSCVLAKGHGGGHLNITLPDDPFAEHTTQTGGPCTYIYGPNGNRCAFAKGDEQHAHRTFTGLGYVHQNQWRPAQSAEHTPQTGGPGMQPCGNVGPFASMTCIRPVGHSGYHEHPRAGMKMVWSDVTEESVATQLAGLQRKVRAQANQITKLEELRRAAVATQPEYVQLVNRLNEETHHLKAQASLTERENALRRQAETDRDSERERGDRLLEELRRSLAKSDSAESAERTRRFVDRFYRLAGLLGVDTAGETWDTLLQRVADLRTELEVERVRANARKAELDKLNSPRVTGHDAVRMFMGPAAEYGTDPVAARVIELASRVAELVKDQDSTSRVMHVLNERLSKLETGAVLRCESRHSDRRCVSYTGHNGVHHAGPGTERW